MWGALLSQDDGRGGLVPATFPPLFGACPRQPHLLIANRLTDSPKPSCEYQTRLTAKRRSRRATPIKNVDFVIIYFSGFLSRQSRNVPLPMLFGVRVILRSPVKQRQALVATNLIED